MKRSQLFDIKFPKEHILNAPVLLPTRQLLAPAMPARAWGSSRRKKEEPGIIWHFYVADPRFENLLKKPETVIKTGASGCVEINSSISLNSDRGQVIDAIYWKRRVSRIWQHHGIDISVDVNFPTEFCDLCFIGVPDTWQSFSTRGYAARPENLLAEYAMCRAFSKADQLTFMIFGGGREIKEMCEQYALNGWIYFPSFWEQRQGSLNG
jgi:hypothetical protein